VWTRKKDKKGVTLWGTKGKKEKEGRYTASREPYRPHRSLKKKTKEGGLRDQTKKDLHAISSLLYWIVATELQSKEVRVMTDGGGKHREGKR